LGAPGSFVHFEIQASHPQPLVNLYAGLFGWSFTKWEGPAVYWLIKTGPSDQPGINGGLLPRRGPAPLAEMPPVNAFVCTVEIPSLENALSQSIALRGTIVLPKMPIPGVGWLVYVKDPDGNMVGLLQPDRQAA
jgi:predicted enzyme related to lactoylglutathione lyase